LPSVRSLVASRCECASAYTLTIGSVPDLRNISHELRVINLIPSSRFMRRISLPRSLRGSFKLSSDFLTLFTEIASRA